MLAGVGHVLDRAVYVALRAAWGIARYVPLPVLRAGLRYASVLVYAVDVRHRDIVHANLAQAFPDLPSAERVRLARAAFGCWGRIAAELAHADEMAKGRTLDGVRAMVARAEELGAEGRGVLALTAHTGNFELLARLLGSVGRRRVVLFHRPMANPFVGEFLVRQRAVANVGTLGRGMVVREALRVLARGEILVVPLDQNQSRKRGVFVSFFGRPACTSTTLARLSLTTGLPVQPCFAAWEGGALVPVMGEAIAPPRLVRGDDRAAAILELTERYTRAIEALVRRYPAQWNWAHRRWKTRPVVRDGSGGSDGESSVISHSQAKNHLKS
jgi:KDO2-lipid IV(A) lauroyltransferase